MTRKRSRSAERVRAAGPSAALLTPDEAADNEHAKANFLSYLTTHDTTPNAVMWWTLNSSRFHPAVVSLALKYLCIPCSSAPVERQFSTTKEFDQCGPEWLENLATLAHGLRNEDNLPEYMKPACGGAGSAAGTQPYA